jgi:hypothetical protein
VSGRLQRRRAGWGALGGNAAPPTGLGSTNGTLIFNFDKTLPWTGTNHLTKYDFVPGSQYAFLVPDPKGTLDRDAPTKVRTVIRASVPNSAAAGDTGARWQAEIFPMLNVGDEIWEGWSHLFSDGTNGYPSHPRRNATLAVHGLHGAFGTNAQSNSPLRIDMINDQNNSDGTTGQNIHIGRSGNYNQELIWKLQVNGQNITTWDLRGRWVDFVLHFRIGNWSSGAPTDDTGGWVEVYINLGNGWERQIMQPATTFHGRSADTYRAYYDTADPNTNGLPPYDTRVNNYYLANAYTNSAAFPYPTVDPLTMWINPQRLARASTANASAFGMVNPGSYDNQTGAP